jgi:glycine cleavage system regulatory protein
MTARWAAQVMADGGIRYEDLDSSWFVRAASAMILNKHNINIALYDDDSDITEEEESADLATAERTMEGPAEEHSGVLTASFKSLCNFL